MTRRQVETGKQYGHYDYGFQVWVHRRQNIWLFNGMFGQNMFIDADRKLVVAVNASNPDLFQTNPIFEIYERIFLDDRNHWNPVDLDTLVESLKARAEVRPWWKRLFQKEDMLPAGCYELDGTSFEPVRLDATLGIMPRMMQILENQYTTGLDEISFRINENRFWVCVTEGKAVYYLPVGFGRFGRDEDGRLVLILEIAFLETPFHRYFRCYFGDGEMEFRGDESPGRDFVTRFVETMGRELLEKPLVSGILEKLDTDLLEYKLDVMFKPDLKFRQTNPIPKNRKD